MTCKAMEPLLDDYADGTLDAARRQHAEAHLRECAACRAEVQALRGLAARVAAAPRSVQPSADHWLAIRSRMPAGSSVEGDVSRRGWRVQAWQLAAAVVLMALSSAATVWVMRQASDAKAPPPVASTQQQTPPQLRLIDAQYVPVATDLAALLDAHRAELAPSTVTTVERSLRTIDQAIAEARAALARDPNNSDLAHLLSSGYEQKIDLLRRTSQLMARS